MSHSIFTALIPYTPPISTMEFVHSEICRGLCNGSIQLDLKHLFSNLGSFFQYYNAFKALLSNHDRALVNVRLQKFLDDSMFLKYHEKRILKKMLKEELSVYGYLTYYPFICDLITSGDVDFLRSVSTAYYATYYTTYDTTHEVIYPVNC